MKPIIVNLPEFTIGRLNDNADYCINVRDVIMRSREIIFVLNLDCRKILL